MIAYLEGLLAETWGTSCIVVTRGGVGYELDLPAHTMASLPGRGESVALYTSLVVREDAQQLFGFATFEERQVFEVLLTISKVGARTALAILSLYRPDDLRRIVAEDDAAALTQVSGIGKKTAQQIFLELKYKLKGDAPVSLTAAAGRPSVYKDALTGLANLGYDEDTAGQVLRKVLENDPELEVGEALRAALKALARGKM